MLKLNKILWFLVILFIVIPVITFTFGIILVGGAMVGLFGIYNYYLGKKRINNLKVWPKGFSSGEVIEMPKEIINHSIYRKE